MTEFDFAAYIEASTSKDADRWLSFFAEDAEWTEYRYFDPPRAPHRMRGMGEIEPFVRGISASAVELTAGTPIVTDDAAAFSIDCLLPDGRRIYEHVMIEIADGKIARQTDVEAWDPPVGEDELAAASGSSPAVLAVEAWLARYGDAWAARDADAAAGLFSDDALYAWGPFDELRGREAIRDRWALATDSQRGVRFASDVLGETREGVVARWRCLIAAGEGDGEVEIDGVCVVRLDADGRCAEFREWWARRTAP